MRRGCALLVASVAAYASCVHQRACALQGRADATSAVLWPLSVDGLLLLATVGLLKPTRHVSRRARCTVRMAFFLRIAVSPAANGRGTHTRQAADPGRGVAAGRSPVLGRAARPASHGPSGERERAATISVVPCRSWCRAGRIPARPVESVVIGLDRWVGPDEARSRRRRWGRR
ncbi:DUF2637 domain-containing protein [Streptomyces sp. NPDC048415]|uniref:DUF2637 domain-containing protein n=1 Tax=Streptomyces sp. NPDC048415 TaxID=3154822 RepID=UPI00343867B2